jgi:hypothetical protein
MTGWIIAGVLYFLGVITMASLVPVKDNISKRKRLLMIIIWPIITFFGTLLIIYGLGTESHARRYEYKLGFRDGLRGLPPRNDSLLYMAGYKHGEEEANTRSCALG